MTIVTQDTPVVETEDNLDSFAEDFFSPAEDTTKPETEAPTEEANSEETVEETQEQADVEDEPTPEEKPQKRNRAQERINSLLEKNRLVEEERAALQRQIDELKSATQKSAPTTKTETKDTGPSPDDTNEDGSDKYPLGAFDPSYIQARMEYSLEVAEQKAEARRTEQAAKQTESEARAALEAEWQSKLGPAQERYPDFAEKSEALAEHLGEIPPAYSEYLAATFMGMEFGPDVLYYLGEHPEEASRILSSGPTQATIALGRIEARFAQEANEPTRPSVKVSSAPPPPTGVLKGSTAVVPEVPGDTDDLDAFAAALFKKSNRR